MHRAVQHLAEHALVHHDKAVPLLLAVLGAVATVHSPTQHALLVQAVSWALICVFATLRAGIWGNNTSKRGRAARWAAGGFFALGHICDRAACDKAGTWATKGLLPVLVFLAAEYGLLAKALALPSYHAADDSASDGSTAPSELQSSAKSARLLAIATVAASIALACRYATAPTSALGVSSVVFTAAGLVLFEHALKSSKDDGFSRKGFMSANGTFSRRSSQGSPKGRQLAAVRDIAFVLAVVCGLATYIVEPPISARAITWEPVYRELPGDWKTLHYQRSLRQCVLMIFVNFFLNVLLSVVLSNHGAVPASFLLLFSCICARLHVAHSFSSIWFTIIYALAAFLFVYSPSSTAIFDLRSSIRLRRIIIGVTAISFAFWLFHAVSPGHGFMGSNTSPAPNAGGPDASLPGSGALNPLAPIELDLSKGHPAAQLIEAAEKDFQAILGRQSKTLAEAVQEYRRRNGIVPPPHFDKWYEFAVRNNVQLIDEFDTINRLLLPYWALKPSIIRERVRLALGNNENSLIGALIRDGNVVKIENGQEWQQQATVGMMKSFVQYLPDMDLAFNIHDEPRVIVPNDQLAALVEKARDHVLPTAAQTKEPRNSFSKRPADLGDGKRFDDVSTSRFNRFAHQQTWTNARLSCPMNTQARVEDAALAADNLTAYAAGPLNYIYNATAFSDICNSPSFGHSFGFFERPNAFSITHELTPIFSQSKISSFQDILYPSPWYWFGKVGYDEWHDTEWANKTNRLYWRGSTTGGFSRAGGWRRQHRQRIVKNLNARDDAEMLVPSSPSPSSSSLTTEADGPYTLTTTPRASHAHLIDIAFSHIGQCDPGDCLAQSEFFNVVERVDAQDAWYYKHLLDMDGNAFSGRFYAFLKSRSLVYKMAVFREWHEEWLRPWVHYVPLGLGGREGLDLVGWFGGASAGSGEGGASEVSDANEGGEGNVKGGEGARSAAGAAGATGAASAGEDVDASQCSSEDDGTCSAAQQNQNEKGGNGNGDSLGERKAREIAARSREWAFKALRNEDFEVWFFRLLLEYGRVVDDGREGIGYAGP